MELIPALNLGWLNGWIPFLLFCLVEGILLMAFPREVVKRLFDRSTWNRAQVTFTGMGKILALVCLVLIIFTPLKINSAFFIIGMVLYVLGLAGLIIALFNFKNTPPDQPVTIGLYRISRHPQVFMQFTVILGICLAISSWPALFMLLIAKILGHFGILAEERTCLAQYGDSYRAYLKRVHRYFLFL